LLTTSKTSDDKTGEKDIQLAENSRSGRWKRHPVTRTLAGILLVFLPLPLTMFTLSRLVDRSARIVWPQVLVGAICFFAYRFFVHRVENRPMTEFSRKGAFRELGLGLLLGSLMASAVFAFLALGGVYRLDGFDGMSLEVLRRTATAVLVAPPGSLSEDCPGARGTIGGVRRSLSLVG